MATPYTPSERRQIRELYAAELPWAEIEERIGRSIPGMQHYLRKVGLLRSRSAAARLKAEQRYGEHTRRLEEAIELVTRRGWIPRAAAVAKRVKPHTLRCTLANRGIRVDRGRSFRRRPEARADWERKLEVGRRLREGESGVAVAEDLGVHPSTIWNWAEEVEAATGIPTRPLTLQRMWRDRGMRMLLAGAELGAVAQASHVTRETAMKWRCELRRLGLMGRDTRHQRAA